MNGMVLKAPAKINFTLDVLSRRPDGYHELETVMQSVSLYDELTLSFEPELKGSIQLKTNLRYLPTDSRNLAFSAAQAFFSEAGIEPPGLIIELKKRIPVAAGLAGGSTDAAAVLRGLSELFKGSVSREKCLKIAGELGADVPFCFTGGAALARGVGEKLTVLPPLQNCSLVIVKPDFKLSTRWVFENLVMDEVKHPNTSLAVEALLRGDAATLAGLLGNALETVSVKRYPQIGRIKERLLECGAAGALMSGSGPAVFGMFLKREKAVWCQQALKREGLHSFLAHPVGPLKKVNKTEKTRP